MLRQKKADSRPSLVRCTERHMSRSLYMALCHNLAAILWWRFDGVNKMYEFVSALILRAWADWKSLRTPLSTSVKHLFPALPAHLNAAVASLASANIDANQRCAGNDIGTLCYRIASSACLTCSTSTWTYLRVVAMLRCPNRSLTM